MQDNSSEISLERRFTPSGVGLGACISNKHPGDARSSRGGSRWHVISEWEGTSPAAVSPTVLLSHTSLVYYIHALILSPLQYVVLHWGRRSAEATKIDGDILPPRLCYKKRRAKWIKILSLWASSANLKTMVKWIFMCGPQGCHVSRF